MLLTQKPLFARAGGARCVLSVYLAGQFGCGSSESTTGNVGQFGRTERQAARRALGLLYYAGHTGIWGGGVAEKQPVPSGRGVGYIIRTHFPIPRHLTALCRTSSPPHQIPPVSHPYPHTACRGPRRGCRKRGRCGLWKRRGEMITGNSPGYGVICRGPVFARMAWDTNLCE